MAFWQAGETTHDRVPVGYGEFPAAYRLLDLIVVLRLRPAVVVFLITVAIRGFLLSHTPEPEFLYGQMTPKGFHSGEEGINVAVALARRGEFADPFCQPTGPTAHLPPAYPFVTAAVFRLFGYGHTAAWVRNGISIAGFGLLYGSFPAAAAALGLGAVPGVIAGIAAAVYPSFRSSEVFRGRDEWAAALGLLWLTILVFRILDRRESRLRDAGLFGIGWGLLLLIQPSTVTVLPVHALIWLFYPGRQGLVRRFSHVLFAAALVFVTLLPWTIRNYQRMGAWFFVRDNAGLELRISHGDGAQPSLTANQKTGWYRSVHPSNSATAVSEIRRIGEVNFHHQLLREARSWIAAHPERFRELTLARIAAFWADLPHNRHTFAVRLFWSLFGGLGLCLMWRAGYRLQTLLIAPAIIVYPLVYYAVQYSSRYFVPICYAVFIPAGFAIDRLYWALRATYSRANNAYVGRR